MCSPSSSEDMAVDQATSMSIDTACSGGLTSVDVACHYLRSGKISGAMVAAANLQLSPEVMMDTGSMRAAWSPSGRCHSFDAKADGYCRAEAVNAVFLKLLSDAVRDGDPIRAIIRGQRLTVTGTLRASPAPAARPRLLRSAPHMRIPGSMGSIPGQDSSNATVRGRQ